MTPVLEKKLDAVVKAGLFRSREEVLAEAVNVFFAVRPAMQLEAAIELFKEGEVSLSRAAEMVGADVMTFRKVLVDRGVSITVECDQPKAMDAAITAFFGA